MGGKATVSVAKAYPSDRSGGSSLSGSPFSSSSMIGGYGGAVAWREEQDDGHPAAT
ncbi:hypothetical protein SESBI_25312 [Sesbania bispinosa]|nr:hypothetical protein SESBI_25312 [Sesbania bispinosa]